MQLLIDAQTGERGSVEAWVGRFAELWHGGRQRLDDFMRIFAPEIVLSAPGLRSTRGHAAGREAFRRTFEVFPDMTATIGEWADAPRVLFVEIEFVATIGGKAVRWRGVDRFRIEQGAVVERIAFFNPLRVRRALLAHPRGWVQMLQLMRSRG